MNNYKFEIAMTINSCNDYADEQIYCRYIIKTNRNKSIVYCSTSFNVPIKIGMTIDEIDEIFAKMQLC